MRPEVLPPTSAQRHKPKAFDHGYHSLQYPDAATKGPGFDPSSLKCEQPLLASGLGAMQWSLSRVLN